MQRIAAAGLLLCLVLHSAFAQDKPTSLSDAQASVEANLRTSEGKAYDEKLAAEFPQKQVGTIRQCKQAAGDDLRSFWFLMKLDKDGAVKEVLLSPTTKLGTCARETLLQSGFSTPPRPSYWVSVYLQLAR